VTRSSSAPLNTSSRDDAGQPAATTDDSHRSPDQVQPGDNCGVTVMQTSNVGGQRKWDKKHFCFYCDEPQSKLPRHLQSCHREEIQVVAIASETDRSIRINLLLRIRNAGNHRHNCQVLRQGEGILIVGYRPNHKADPHAYGPCIYCFGYYVRSDLWRHQCPLKPALPAQTNTNSTTTRVRGRVAHKSDLLKPPPVGVSFKLNQVLSPMKRDNVALVVRNDPLIIELAKREYMKLGHDVGQYGYIRNKVRELGRLVIQLRKNTNQPNAALAVFVHPHHLNDIVTAVRDIAGFNEVNQLYQVPSLALKIGHSIKKCALIVKGDAIESGLKQKAEQAEQFLQLCEMKWRERVSTHAHRTLQQGKRNKPVVLPTNADVVKMSSFIHDTGDRELQSLKAARGKQIRAPWKKLNEVTLCHLIMFNRRRQGEVSKMTVEDFTKHNAAVVNRDCVLTDVERHLCKMFKLVEIVGKRGRTVPVLLSTEAMTWLNALVANRIQAGVSQDNAYLFARSCYGGTGHIRGSDCLRAYATEAGLENADSIRSTKLRKHVATASQILALKEHQLETLADFMGHDLQVHREYYQLPDTVQRVTQLSRLFLSLERGNLASQHGKSLQELHVTGGKYLTLSEPPLCPSIPSPINNPHPRVKWQTCPQKHAFIISLYIVYSQKASRLMRTAAIPPTTPTRMIIPVKEVSCVYLSVVVSVCLSVCLSDCLIHKVTGKFF